MDPNGSQYNILIRVVAAQARREIAKLKAELAAINAQMAKAGKGNAAAGVGGVTAASMKASATATAAATSSTMAYQNALRGAGGASASASAATDKLASAIGRARIAETNLNEVRAMGSKTASTVLAAEARLAAARNAATAATEKVAVAEARLSELQAKKNVSTSTLMAAEARLNAARNAASVATQRVAVAEVALSEAHVKSSASATAAVAAEERLVMARRAVVAANAAGVASQNSLTAAQTAGIAAESRLAAASTLNRMRTLGATTVWAGKQISLFFTAPLLLAGAAAFKWQMDNERAAAHLVKVYDNTGAEAKAAIEGIGGEFQGSPLDKFFTALSEKMGVAKAEITEMGAAWAAVGATGRQLANFTRLTSEAMVLGDLEQVEATDALIAIQAQYKLSSRDLERTLWTLNATENATGASMGDLITAYAAVAANARAAGIDQAHLAAMISSLVPASGSAARAGNGLKSIITHFANPDTEKAREAFRGLAESAGLMSDAFLSPGFKSKNMTQRLEEIADVYGNLSGQAKVEFANRVAGIFQISRAEQLLGDIYARNTDSLSYYRQALENNNDAFQENIKDTKTFQTYQKELQTVLESNPKKFQQVGQIIKNSMTDVIIPLIPHILWLAKGVAKVAKAFANLDPTMQKWIVIALVALALIGPISSLIGGFILLGSTVGRTFGVLGRTLSRLLFHFTGLRTGVYMAGKAMGETVPFIKKLGNMFKWLFGIQTATDAASTASTGANQAARVSETLAGESAQTRNTVAQVNARTLAITTGERSQLLAITTGNAAKATATAAGQAAQTAEVAAGQASQSTIFAASQTGQVTAMTAAQAAMFAMTGTHQVVMTRVIAAGQARQLLAIEAGLAAATGAYAASATGQVTALTVAQRAIFRVTGSMQAAQVKAIAAGQGGQIAAIGAGISSQLKAITAGESAKLKIYSASATGQVEIFSAAQAAIFAITSGGQTAQLSALTVGESAKMLALTAGQSSQMLALTAGQSSQLLALTAGLSSQLLAIEAGSAAQLKVFMASQAGIVQIITAGQLAALQAVVMGQQAIARAYAVNASGVATILSSSKAVILAAEAETQAALFGVVSTGSNNLRRVFVATQAGHVAIIQAGTPRIVAAQAAQNAAQLAAIRTGQAANVAAVRQGQLAITAASVSGGAAAGAAGGAAAAGAAGGAAAKGKGAAAGIAAMFSVGPIVAKIKTWGPAIRAALSKVFSIGGLRAAIGGSKILGLFTGPIGWAILAAITLIAMFPKQIADAIEKMWDSVWRIVEPIFGNSDIPILARPFVATVEVIKSALMALPGIVVAVFKAVVRVIQAAGQKIYQAFSYINPFARHSPSLVENVTEGMAIVTNEFADADKSIQNSMRSAYATINKFGSATAGLNFDVESRARNKRREEIQRVDPGALASYDEMLSTQDRLEQEMLGVNRRIKEQEQVVKSAEAAVDSFDKQIDEMNKTLDSMQTSIDAMNETLETLQEAADFAADRLSDAKDKLDKYANAPIKGMRAMEDQIFANEMAQKRLQLALLDLDSSAIDDATDRFARLQGRIETLSGTRNELRLGGAGSDILGVYDEQLAALKAQQEAVEENLGPIREMENELKRLKTEAERLDLEKSLAFDPLERQIKALADTTEELTFDQITSGIASAKSEISLWTGMVNGANAAVDAQQVAIDGATAALDAYRTQIESVENQRTAAQETVDSEQSKLDLLNSTYDQLDQTLQDLTSTLDNYNTSVDTTIQRLEEEARAAEEAARKAKEAQDDILGGGAEDFAIPGGTFDPNELLPSIEEQTDDLIKGIEDSFGKIDLLAPLKNAWQKVKDFFGRVWDDYIWPGLKDIGPKIVEFIKNLPTEIVNALAYVHGYIAGALVKALLAALAAAWTIGTWLQDKFNEMVDKAVSWLTTLENWKNLGTAILNGIVSVAEALITGEFWAKVGEIGMNIITGILKGIGSAIVGIGKWIWDNVIVKFIDGFKDGFDMHSPSKKMAELGVDVLQGLLDGLIGMIGNVLQFFIDLPGKVIESLGDLGSKLVEWAVAAWNWLRDKMPENVQGFMDWMGELPGRILDKLGDGGTALFDFGKNLIQGLLDGAGSLLSKIGQFFLDKVPDWIKEPFKKAMGIESPSKVFAEFGNNVGQGLIVGMNEMAPAVQSATAALADVVASTPITMPELQAQLATAPQAAKVASPTSNVPSEILNDTKTSQDTWDKFGIAMQTSSIALNDGVIAQVQNLGLITEAQFAVTSANSQMTMTSMQTGITSTATLMHDNVVDLATNMTNQVTTQLSQLKDEGVSAMQGTKDGVTLEFQSMSDNLNTIFGEQIKPMFDEFQPMLSATEGWFKDTVTNIGTQWSGIQEKVAEPSRFVVNEVYNKGVKEAWNKVNTWLGLPPLEDFVAGFQSGGVVDRSSLRNASAARNISNGGKLNNFGMGDSTLFAGQGGEFVVPRKMAKQIGYDNLESARRAALSGRSTEGMGSVLGFAQGGTVPGAVLDTETMLLKHARGQKYVYGGAGPDGFDCSGIASAVWNSLTGQPNLWKRAFTTEANFASYGFERGLNGWATIGVKNGGGGPLSHMAGTLNGRNYESGGAHNSTAYGGPASGSDHPQFQHQYTLKEIGGIFQSGGMGGAGVPSMAARVMEVWKQVMDPIGALAGNGSPLSNIARPGFDKYNGAVGEFLKGKGTEWDVANRGRSGGFGGIGSGVEVWRSTVQQVLSDLGLPLSWDELTLAQMQTESGGNQYALNDWDSNWIKGTPSKGLMQVIDPTFAAYRWPGYVNDIWDPKANIAAGLRWVMTKGGPQGIWGQGHGYDSGGWLAPGVTTAVNKTKKPEAILTNEDWNAIYAAANNPLDVEDVARGVEIGMKRTFGFTPVDNITQEQAEKTAAALDEVQGGWQQNIYDATKVQTDAVHGTTTAVQKTEKGIDNVAKITGQVSDGVSKLSSIMLTISTALQTVGSGGQVTFGMIAPIFDGIADIVESLPDATPTYVPWAGFDVVMTEEMKRQKAANDAANAAKGSYMIAKGVLPGLLRSVSSIGTAIENLIIQDSAAWATAIGLLSTGNPMGAILIIALVLKEIFTIVPLILKAITDIVPNLIKAIVRFLTDFAPDATFAYENIDDAVAAVAKNEADMKSGKYQQQWEGSTIDAPVNQSTTLNFYGDIVLPNITSGDQAEEFSQNLQNLAEG